jgi:hypothetical protein
LPPQSGLAATSLLDDERATRGSHPLSPPDGVICANVVHSGAIVTRPSALRRLGEVVGRRMRITIAARRRRRRSARAQRPFATALIAEDGAA